jgi:hypothetical protein
MLRKSQKNRRASRREYKTRNLTRRLTGGTTHYSGKHHPHGSIKHHTKVGGTTHYSGKHHPHGSINKHHAKVGGTTHYSGKHHPHGSFNKHHAKVGGTTHYSAKHHPHGSFNKHHAKVGGATHHRPQPHNKFSPAPFQKVGYLPGANSPRENAMIFTKTGADNQHYMNKMAGGMSALQPAAVGTATVPQFPTAGPPGGTVTANSSSVVTNTASIAGKTNAVGDCYATNSCAKGQSGGDKKYRKNI